VVDLYLGGVAELVDVPGIDAELAGQLVAMRTNYTTCTKLITR
jgi:hypothetical protein